MIGGQSLRFQYDYIQFTAQTGGLGGGGGVGDRGEKGAGGAREAGEEGAGSGIPKVAGSGKREKKGEIMQHYCAIFCNRKTAKRNRAGTSITGYGKQEV